MRTKLRVLCGNAHRTGIQITFTHHHASQNYQGCCTKAILLGTKQRHEHDVATALQLTVYLQANLSAQTILNQGLLSLRQTNLWRNTCKAHARSRTCTCTALGSRDYYQVGFSLCHTCCDGAHSALGNKLHANGCTRVHILEVEDELRKVFDRIDVVVRWWRNKADARDRMASLCDDVVDLETWQLTTLAWLCALGNLDLYFFGINKIFGSNSESSTCHLLGLARQRYSIYF